MALIIGKRYIQFGFQISEEKGENGSTRKINDNFGFCGVFF